ncbi:MAG: RHS repeat-associated core domain-containing protein, partial [Kiritimatiellia bacterium]
VRRRGTGRLASVHGNENWVWRQGTSMTIDFYGIFSGTYEIFSEGTEDNGINPDVNNGTFSTIRYYWGKDMSGTLQGAGGVGGLLFLTIDGAVYVPCHDNNGNVMRYLDSAGGTVATYVYDAFGNTISQSGALASTFRHRFSTKYFDAETGLHYYGYRFYSPPLMRWINRDPIEEAGGVNVYAFCGNGVVFKFDRDGRAYFALRPLANMPWLGLVSHNILDDLLNTEIAHEHLFFEDGKSPSNYGLHAEAGVDGKQIFHDEEATNYRHFERGYDDCIMRIAVANVKPRPYSLLGSLKNFKYNCQDYCSDLRREYFRLLFDKTVRKKCCIGKKRK